jgi:hypothetical protein
MSNSPAIYEGRNDVGADRRLEERPVLTPAQELNLADGYRWASLEIVDLDPPTWFPPQAAD